MTNLAIERTVPSDGPPMLPPELQASYAALRRLAMFDGIPNQVLAENIVSGDVALRELDRDLFIADPIGLRTGAAAPVVYLAAGQVAAAVFDERELAERRAAQERWDGLTDEEREAESLIKPLPLARLARKNVALFLEGDLFNAGALSVSRQAPVAFYTTAPSSLCVMSQAAIAELAVRHPFFEARIRRAVLLARERLQQVTGVKQEVLDFFVRQGISVAGEMVRVRQLDLCIDCKQCEDACEERYGARRLTLGGYQLGLLDFVYTCRTCSDQRCIDPCQYDSIRFDADRGEVVINEATCTGCTACAQSCPYGAIDMVDVSDPGNATFRLDFQKRLEKRGALASGPGTGRVARARRIANKCDHCATYGDQACVSACPTGSLIEVSAQDLFRERTPLARAAARAGYDQEILPEGREVLPTYGFTEGLAVRDGGKAKVRRGRYAPLLFWVVGLAVFAVALTEILLRLYAPTMSWQFHQLQKMPDLVGLPVAAVVEKVSYRSGDQLAVWCGFIGTGLMLVAAVYPMFRRVRLFRWLASNTMWFDFHMMAGWVGPMFIGLHSALKLDSWVASAFWSMVIVVVSGAIGRYLYTMVPSVSRGNELEELDHERAFARYRGQNPVAMADIDKELTRHRERADAAAGRASVLYSLAWLLAEDARRPGRWLARRGRLTRLGVTGKARREILKRTGHRMLIDRGRVTAPQAQRLLRAWKWVHVPFTIFLVALSAAHIYISLPRAW
ncbi:MAG: 4Fe-4S dicluster domain-containing protein [Kofleriaceae bacterium]|nr:4Fe-4S dicluster domain-containing protein [Myxococcales bacterium]MCB9564341.1 4Fe-4S dicluster domain-containing protein [Kofleriaceae bacterium]MCB9574689.1 4Fe-4S dicluster domain-containing protein [Kofleriaceae bacterium]